MGRAQLTIDEAIGVYRLTRQDAGSSPLACLIAGIILAAICACLLRIVLPIIGPETVADAPWPLWLAIEAVLGPVALVLIAGAALGMLLLMWAVLWPWLGGLRTLHLDAAGLSISDRLPGFVGQSRLIPFERLRGIRSLTDQVLADVEEEDGTRWPQVLATDLAADDLKVLHQRLSVDRERAAAEWAAQGLHIGHVVEPSPAPAQRSD